MAINANGFENLVERDDPEILNWQFYLKKKLKTITGK